MDDLMLKNSFADNVEEWVYPHIEISSNFSHLDIDNSNNEWLELKTVQMATPDQNKNNKPQIDNHITQQENILLNELKAKEAEVELLKSELQKTTFQLQKIGDQLKNFLHIIDQELLNMLTQIVKKTIKKLIVKDIELNPDTLINIIMDLKKAVPGFDELHSVILSEYDTELFKKTNLADSFKITSDSSLASGDVILKTKFSEISAVLDERINQLLG